MGRSVPGHRDMPKSLEMSRCINDSEKRHADKIGITYQEYEQHKVNRLEEMRKKLRPKFSRNDKCHFVYCSNPVLLIGAGPSYRDNFEKIKNFKGIKVCFEVNLEAVVNHGVIPDYIMTMEIYVRPDDFFKEDIVRECKGKSKVICSAITHQSVINRLVAVGIEHERWISPEEPRFANVGTFGLVYAKQVLKADKIFLVGFEHDGVVENEKVYEYWVYDFWYFVHQWPKETIVNCTNGGALYDSDYILDSTLDSLVV